MDSLPQTKDEKLSEMKENRKLAAERAKTTKQTKQKERVKSRAEKVKSASAKKTTTATPASHSAHYTGTDKGSTSKK